MLFSTFTGLLALAATPALSCDSCYGPSNGVVHQRTVRRMQPDAENATAHPKGPLAWGELNFLHTTDTHGWLEGHIKEQNYGADWGDFVTFSKDMKKKADALKTDLLFIDTGDLHDGAGLSDAESPNGVYSNPIFENLDYDLLTIGNHELYISDIAYLTATTFAKMYGDRYISSNVQIYNNKTEQYENIANQYRYFTTKHGLRIMAFGVLFDFTGNSNASKVTPAKTMVQQQWFLDAVNCTSPIDLFLVTGHNPVRGTTSTLSTVYNSIRAIRPDVPIQMFGGHSHIRDFAVYDAGTTGIESGRYCETLGWVSMSGIKSKTYKGSKSPKGVPHPTQRAIKVSAQTVTTASTSTASASAVPSAFSDLVYSRRYLDWNRLTFAYHAEGSQSKSFDTSKGLAVTKKLTSLRKQLNLTSLYGCAPQTWCQTCAPFGSSGNIFSLLETALATTVINETRKDIPRLIIINTGSIRFDLVEGPFTFDDSFIVSPFSDTFQYLPNVPYSQAKQVLGILNKGAFQKRTVGEEHAVPTQLESRDFAFNTAMGGDDCVDAATSAHEGVLARRGTSNGLTRVPRGTNATLVPGYTTSDDFGTDGDDTVHSNIAYYAQPNDLQANASFPADGSMPDSVDLIFLDFIGAGYVVPALKTVGASYTAADILQYLPPAFDTNAYLPAYAKIAPEWQVNVPNCPVGKGVGF